MQTKTKWKFFKFQKWKNKTILFDNDFFNIMLKEMTARHLTYGIRSAAMRLRGFSRLGHFATLIPTPLSTHSLGRGQCYALPYCLPKPSYTCYVNRHAKKFLVKHYYRNCLGLIINWIKLESEHTLKCKSF